MKARQTRLVLTGPGLAERLTQPRLKSPETSPQGKQASDTPPLPVSPSSFCSFGFISPCYSHPSFLLSSTSCNLPLFNKFCTLFYFFTCYCFLPHLGGKFFILFCSLLESHTQTEQCLNHSRRSSNQHLLNEWGCGDHIMFITTYVNSGGADCYIIFSIITFKIFHNIKI